MVRVVLLTQIHLVSPPGLAPPVRCTWCASEGWAFTVKS